MNDSAARTQLDANGKLRHLLTLEDLPADRIVALLDRAESLREQTHNGATPLKILHGRTVINLFFEPSTRTRTSFDLAAKRLGANVINFDIASSSTTKGESLIDTVHTLEAMHCDAFVVRHKESGTPEYIARNLALRRERAECGRRQQRAPDARPARCIDAAPASLRFFDANGGDLRRYPPFARRALGRACVARARGEGNPPVLAARNWRPTTHDFPHCRIFHNFDDAIEGVDVAIMLRLQKERMQTASIPSEADYFERFGLSSRRLARAHPQCLVMHPGPMNRGVEIAPEVADGPAIADPRTGRQRRFRAHGGARRIARDREKRCA